MTEKLTDDAKEFGEGSWVYCKSHRRPHTTGWCTVPANKKVRLEATDFEAAQAECRAKEYPLFEDEEAERQKGK